MSICSDLVYLSAGCNTSPHCVSWGQNGILLYGSDANVIVCNSTNTHNGIVAGFQACHSLRHHTDSVNCIRWIRSSANPTASETEFISLSTDKTCAVWSLLLSGGDGHRESLQFSMVQQLEHSAPLQVGKAVYHNKNSRLDAVLALTGIDGSVTIWVRQNQAGFERLHVLEFGRGLILDLDLTSAPENAGILLACGGDDGKVHVFCFSKDVSEHKKIAALPGHEDWIRSVEFSAPDENGVLHLLSTGQDCTVRLWMICQSGTRKLDAGDLWNKINCYGMNLFGSATEYQIVYETLLFGHEGWIYGAHWAPPVLKDEGIAVQPLRILSASMDKTVILWEPQDQFGGIWCDAARVGEVGGNNLGFYGCQFSPDGNTILSHSFSGSLHMWKCSEDRTLWTPAVVPGGHFSAVNDIAWDPRGLYLLSTSQDQTTRLHAPWKSEFETKEWHELARPQVHGYDLMCLASTGNYSFASGAEEKIIRHFQAPKSFLHAFSELSKIDVGTEAIGAPEGASLPSLGLSNKPTFENENDHGVVDIQRHPTDRYAETVVRPAKTRTNQPPPEEDLIQNTLWPESQKLYGHGYEISSVTCNYSRSLLATASRASHPEHAEIFLWSSKEYGASTSHSWTQVGRIAAHVLTVTQMEFSHNDDYLLSVSRDRTWALSRGTTPYVVCARPEKKSCQTRIIWTCAWSPDDQYFATGSRDKTETGYRISIKLSPTRKVFIYRMGAFSEDSGKVMVDLLHRLTFDGPAAALDFASSLCSQERYILAVGLEDGHIEIYGMDRAGMEEPGHIITLPEKHHNSVNRIRFQPVGKTSPTRRLLATCGTDRAVKIFELKTC